MSEHEKPSLADDTYLSFYDEMAILEQSAAYAGRALTVSEYKRLRAALLDAASTAACLDLWRAGELSAGWDTEEARLIWYSPDAPDSEQAEAPAEQTRQTAAGRLHRVLADTDATDTDAAG
jgi:hypothetical protein